MSGLGAHHHPVRTTSLDAQAWFDQGMSLVFGFNHEEAVRAFERAAALDPGAAMPHWGMAWALGPNYNLDIDDPRARQATDAVARAKALATDGPDAERAYVDALAVRYSADPKADRSALARTYSRAMQQLAARYPDDLDAAVLYAESLMNLRPWKLWSLDGAPAEGTAEIITVLESVLARDPDHLGANHYYIHAVEASPAPARAMASAHRLETLAPAAGHLVHMPAHIHARTGDHAAAAKANLAGVEADRAYLKTAPPGGFYEMGYYPHNLHFLTDSHMMQGRFEDARQAAEQLRAVLAPHLSMMPMAESMAAIDESVLLRFGRHGAILARPQPPPDRPVLTAWWRFARTVALARTGTTNDAVAERAALDTAIAQVPGSALFGGTGLESARTILTLAAAVADAHLAAARGSTLDAVRLWRAAVAAGDRVPYDEPPIWFYPLRESLGAALLRAGQAADAERVFRDDLDRHPRNPRALFGLRESLRQQAKETAWVERAFDRAWQNADVPLTIDDL
jgi:tetratricopeptide (TPR) repeat protein